MGDSYVNPFVLGAQHVFKEMSQEFPLIDKVSVNKLPYKVSEVAVCVDIHGTLRCQVVYHMAERDARTMASRMMMGVPVDSLDDEMAQSCLREMANIISGNATGIFANQGVEVVITPPQLVFNATAEDFELAAQATRIVCSSLLFQSADVLFVDVLIPPQ